MMRLYQVTQVVVVRQSENPLKLLVHAMGVAASTGWTNPRLDPSGDPNPEDAVLEFGFEADRPQDNSLPMLMPVTASIVVTPRSADAVVVSAQDQQRHGSCRAIVLELCGTSGAPGRRP